MTDEKIDTRLLEAIDRGRIAAETGTARLLEHVDRHDREYARMAHETAIHAAVHAAVGPLLDQQDALRAELLRVYGWLRERPYEPTARFAFHERGGDAIRP